MKLCARWPLGGSLLCVLLTACGGGGAGGGGATVNNNIVFGGTSAANASKTSSDPDDRQIQKVEFVIVNHAPNNPSIDSKNYSDSPMRAVVVWNLGAYVDLGTIDPCSGIRLDTHTPTPWLSDSVLKVLNGGNYLEVQDSNGNYWQIGDDQRAQVLTRPVDLSRMDNYADHFDFHQPPMSGTCGSG